jgi:Protein of unknown function (DUF707)
MSDRRHLVVVRAGDNSLHPQWLPPEGAPRSWDLVVSYFGHDPGMHRRADVRRIDHKGSKWVGLHTLLTEGELDWQAYDRIWMPDDDLALAPQTVDALFELAERHDLALAQPSLSHDSHISHGCTAHNPRFTLRRTNFVELMAPVFSRELLQRVLPTFIENESGWGLDFLWQMFLDRPRHDSGIIDALQMRHTRPVGGPNYARMVAEGKSPRDEMRRLYRKYSLKDVSPMTWSGLTVDGEELHIDRPNDAVRLLAWTIEAARRWMGEAEYTHSMLAHLQWSAPLRAVADRQPRTAAPIATA